MRRAETGDVDRYPDDRAGQRDGVDQGGRSYSTYVSAAGRSVELGVDASVEPAVVAVRGGIAVHEAVSADQVAVRIWRRVEAGTDRARGNLPVRVQLRCVREGRDVRPVGEIRRPIRIDGAAGVVAGMGRRPDQGQRPGRLCRESHSDQQCRRCPAASRRLPPSRCASVEMQASGHDACGLNYRRLWVRGCCPRKRRQHSHMGHMGRGQPLKRVRRRMRPTSSAWRRVCVLAKMFLR